MEAPLEHGIVSATTSRCAANDCPPRPPAPSHISLKSRMQKRQSRGLSPAYWPRASDALVRLPIRACGAPTSTSQHQSTYACGESWQQSAKAPRLISSSSSEHSSSSTSSNLNSNEPILNVGFLFDLIFPLEIPILSFWKKIQSLIYSSKLNFYSDLDLDARWLLELLLTLSSFHPRNESEFKNPLLYHAIQYDVRLSGPSATDFGTKLALIPLETFQIQCAIIQHLCARNFLLERAVLKGVRVFYAYIFNHWAKHQEEIVLRSLKEIYPDIFFSFSSFVTKHFPEAELFFHNLHNTSTSSSSSFFSTSIHSPPSLEGGEEEKEKEKENIFETPKYILKVPWIQALFAVKTRRVFLKDGYAYLDYTHMSGYVTEMWQRYIKEYVLWDEAFVEKPWIANERQRQKDWSSLEAFEQKHLYDPFKRLMQRGSGEMFVSELFANQAHTKNKKQLLQRLKVIYDLHLQYSTSIPTLMFRSVHSSSSSSSSSSSNRFVVENPSGDLMTDYGSIMPPCIKIPLETHMSNKTHHIFQERYNLFAWCHKVNVPLDTLERTWDELLFNDRKLSKMESNTLKENPKQIYKSQEQKGLNFRSCATLKSSCITPDIEDLGKRQSNCKTHCGITQDPPNGWSWSPMHVTYQLSRRRS